jgi:hypothetical protein
MQKHKSMGMLVSSEGKTLETTPVSLRKRNRLSFGTVPFEVETYDRDRGLFSYRFHFPPMRLSSGLRTSPSKAR